MRKYITRIILLIVSVNTIFLASFFKGRASWSQEYGGGVVAVFATMFFIIYVYSSVRFINDHIRPNHNNLTYYLIFNVIGIVLMVALVFITGFTVQVFDLR